MMQPPGIPNITDTFSRISASHMICAPVRDVVRTSRAGVAAVLELPVVGLLLVV
jgi:hypothetical protein